MISGSELAYPNGMRDSIMGKVKQAYLEWLTFTMQAEVKKHEKAIGDEFKLPNLRLPPALVDFLDAGLLGLEYHLKKEDSEDAVRLRKFAKSGKMKDLKGFKRSNMHYVYSLLEEVKDESLAPRTAKKAAQTVLLKLSEATSPKSDIEMGWHKDMLKQATAILQYLHREVGKVKGPASKLASVEWKEDVDLSDLPSQYKDLVPSLKWIKVHFRVDKRVKKWAGSYNHGRYTLTIFAPTALPGVSVKRAVDSTLSKVGETVEHELRHMVQNMLQDQHGGKAGTRYGKREELPGHDPKMKYRTVSKEAYPGASKEERYYLEPKEFYPNLETAVFRFKDKFDGMLRSPTKAEFKEFVGLLPGRANPFFASYRKHDKKRYKKAVQEAWQRLSDIIE